MLATRLSSHLKQLTKKEPAVHKQFVASCAEGQDCEGMLEDPLLEEHFTAVRGLVHKYKNRALVLLTLNCAAYCRFCTRRRKVSDIERGIITEKDLNAMASYLKKHQEIKELVISGGDPLTVPDLLKKSLQKFSKLPQIKIIRVGTRLPAANPKMVNQKVIDALKVVKKQPLYLMVHFEHPAEITKPTIQAIKKLQAASTMLLSQSVFLKDVNDSADILCNLFTRLVEIGVKPYYIFRCDPVKGAEHFIVDFEKEAKIMTEVRRRVGGLACPMYVIDAPNGSGKIPVPLDFWEFDRKKYKDFEGEIQKI
ncbi:MAG: KamA family radical SAM protein [bacterium]